MRGDPPAGFTPWVPEPQVAALLRHVTDVLAVADAEGRIRYASPATETVLGIKPEEAVGMVGFDLVHPDDLAEQAADMVAMMGEERAAEIRGTRDTTHLQMRFAHRDGTWRVLELWAVNSFDDPLIGGLVVTLRDVTERVEAEQSVRASEERFRSLVQRAHDIVSVHDIDGRCLYMSPAVERMLGWGTELALTDYTAALHPEDHARLVEEIQAQFSGEKPQAPIEYRVQHADGSWRYLEGVATDLLADPAVRGVVVNARDVTERRRAQALQATQAQVLELVARSAPPEVVHAAIASMVEEHAAGTSCTISLWDHRAAESQRELDAHSWRAPIVAKDGERVLGEIVLGVAQRRFPTDDERQVMDVAANLAAIALERAEAARRLDHQANHDPLTGLPNRTLFVRRLEELLQDVGRADGLAVLFLDLDRFKDVNDGLGHQIGDQALAALARRIRGGLRESDLVARLGGDEFVILARVEGVQHAALLGERVLERIRQPYEVDGHEVVLTASIGAAVAAPHQTEADQLLRDADVAMYRAKQRGRARVEVFDDGLRAGLLTRLDTEAALRHALERGELRVHYQPVMDLHTEEAVAYEGLARWERPGHGLVLPGDFIPVAENTGLIVPIGEWVVGQVAAQAAAWQRRAPGAVFRVAANLSGRQLAQPDLVRRVGAMLRETGVDPGLLCLEITESVLFDDLTATLLVLDELRALGLQLALDDFGTGYSSLEYLKRLPVEVLKIDRAFVAGIDRDDADAAIVEGVITMAMALGLRVVAEGVERPAQADRLRELGCRYAQGFLFATPCPAEAIAGPAPHVSARFPGIIPGERAETLRGQPVR